MRFQLINTQDIESIGLTLINHKKFSDDRGFLNIECEVEVENFKNISVKESYSKKNVGRGLHFQNTICPQTKIIQVKDGIILDVVFDVNSEEKTVYGFYLESSNNLSVLVPSNYAHGFIALENTFFSYTCLGAYSEAQEVTFNMLESIANLMKFEPIKLSLKDAKQKKIDLNY